MDIIQYIIPAGAIGSVLTWFLSRSLHNARSAKEIHDLYKVMYEDSQETNLNLQKDVRNLQIAFINLERAVSKAVLCKYYDSHCPVRNELQRVKGKFTTKPINGQPSDQQGTSYYPRSGTTEQSGDDDNADELADAPGGRGVS